MRETVFEYIEVDYNRTHRHSANGYLSPEAFDNKSLNQMSAAGGQDQERLEFVSDDALDDALGVVFVLNTSDGKLQSTFMTVEADDPSINILVSTYGAEARIEAVSHRPEQAGSQIQVILTAPQGGEPWG